MFYNSKGHFQYKNLKIYEKIQTTYDCHLWIVFRFHNQHIGIDNRESIRVIITRVNSRRWSRWAGRDGPMWRPISSRWAVIGCTWNRGRRGTALSGSGRYLHHSHQGSGIYFRWWRRTDGRVWIHQLNGEKYVIDNAKCLPISKIKSL